MKNRYKVESTIITGSDASFTAPEFYETDENLQVENENGIYLWKIVDNILTARSSAEIDADYLEIYRAEKLEALRELFVNNWPDSSKAISANQAQYNNAKSGIAGAADIAEVDTEYNTFVEFMDLS